MMMKKISLFLFVLAMMSVVQLGAQEPQENESLFSVTIPANKIYPYSKGYVFSYRKHSMEIAFLFFPYDWFRKNPASNEGMPKGRIRMLDSGNTWPRVSLFYRNGQFSHAKLYIRREPDHESWGIFSRPVNFDAEFENADPPKLNFDGLE
jgi:hypothetical protein